MSATIEAVNLELKKWIGWSESPGSEFIPFQEKWGYPSTMMVEWCGGLICEAVANCGGQVSSAGTACIPNTWWTVAGVQVFQQWGRWHTTPERGDLVYFDWAGSGIGGSAWSVDHVGWVEDASQWAVNGSIVTIEGNVNERCGRFRRWASSGTIVGFGRPRYAAAAPVPPPPPPDPDPLPPPLMQGEDMPTVVQVDYPDTTSKFYGVLGGTVFEAVDDTLSEANGWERVVMSKAAFDKWAITSAKVSRLRIGIDGSLYDELLKKKV